MHTKFNIHQPLGKCDASCTKYINFRYTRNTLNKPIEIYNYLLEHILLKQQAGQGIYKNKG